MQRWVAIMLLSALSATAVANEPLPGDIIQDLNGVQSQLASQASGSADPEVLSRIISHARSQSERLAGGNRADQWASALYHQLAASALVHQGETLRPPMNWPALANARAFPIARYAAGCAMRRRCAVQPESVMRPLLCSNSGCQSPRAMSVTQKRRGCWCECWPKRSAGRLR